MEYTNDQQKALEGLTAWMKTDDLAYTVDGAAGTGKTTIVREFINSLNIPNSKIAVTAPTHKAKKVIQQATDFPAATIQKLLGLRPNVELDDFNPNKPVFDQLADELIKYFSICIIDESSMLNAAAFKLIMEKAKRYNTKIVFLGDAYQLPPVKEEISKVFSAVANKSTLAEVVRQESSNPMTKALLALRNDVKFTNNTGLATMLKVGQMINQDSGFKCYDDNKAFVERLIQYYYATEYEYDKDFVKLLTWTNPDVKHWNDLIRNHILKENATNILNVGEVLMGYNTLINKKTNDIIIQNSEDYIVKKITEAESVDNVPGFYVELCTEEGRTVNVFIVDHDNIELFHTLAKEKYLKAVQLRGSYWRTYLSFKERHLVLQDIYVDPNKPRDFYNLLCKKDLDYGYCLTVHKSQGSTYGNIAVNINNIYKNYKQAERNRLIYVALSRARNMNLLLWLK